MNGDKIIDSRELVEHFEDLKQSFLDDINDWSEDNEHEPLEDWEEYREEFKNKEISTPYDDDFEILEDLENFINELQGYGDFEHGAAIVREDYFKEYMDEMLEDSGEIPDNLPSYLTITVDYDALEMDYISAEWENTSYLMRT